MLDFQKEPGPDLKSVHLMVAVTSETKSSEHLPEFHRDRSPSARRIKKTAPR